MGVVAGFGSSEHSYIRIGLRYDSDPNAAEGISFVEDVSDPSYGERWCDELQIFHNPNAKIPLSHAWLSEVSQFYFIEHERFAVVPDGQVLSSITMIRNKTNRQR